MNSHWIAPFTVRKDEAFRALCGLFVELSQHSTEPGCCECQERLAHPVWHHCVQCRQETLGRFSRSKTATGSGWSRGFTQPTWNCWDCLPFGEGRGEVIPEKEHADVA